MKWTPHPALEQTLHELRVWAEKADQFDILYVVKTRFGALAFFKADIDAMATDQALEHLLKSRIDAIRPRPLGEGL